MIPPMIFGMGSGRCGTWTLHKTLEAQTGVACNHEGIPLPWEVDPGKLWYFLLLYAIQAHGDYIAHVSFVWINYVGLLMGNLVNPKCICLKRDRDEVIESFCKHTPFLNHWTDPESLHWDPNKDTNAIQSVGWPKYDLPKKDAIGAFWDQYYAHAQYLENRYPANFQVFDMRTALNTEAGQREMLTFAGIDEKKQKIFLNQKLNSLGNPKGEINPYVSAR